MNIKNSLNKFLENDKYILSLSFLFLIIFSLPLLLGGGNVPYDWWDNLDANVIWRKLMIDNHILFAGNYVTVSQMMSGVPRVSLGSELNLFVLLAKIFSPAVSLGVNRFLQVMVGFWGMLFLCRNYILKNHNVFPSAVVAILFAILPFWSSGCLSIAMQPLVLFSFLRMCDKKHTAWDWVVMIIYPFASLFVVYGFFFYLLLFGVFFVDWYKNKRINWSLFIALAVLFVLGLLTQYREILCVFTDNGFVSHRTEMIPPSLSRQGVFGRMSGILAKGHEHAPSNHLLLLHFSLIMLFCGWITQKPEFRRLGISLVLLFAVSLVGSLWWYGPVTNIVKHFSFLRMFEVSRLLTLTPLLVFISFTCSIKLFSNFKHFKTILCVLFVCQIYFSLKNDFTYCGLKNIAIGKQNTKTVTFNEYYSEDLFQQIKQYIGKTPDAYRVAALGLHPAILLYNGFYTIDGFSVNYDIRYKHQFAKLIDDELNQNLEMKKNYTTWGSRKCYLFDNEIGWKSLVYKGSNRSEIQSLDIDYHLLGEMNCEYIVSAVKIRELNPDLTLQNIFENKRWKIYLYKVDV